MIKIKVKTSYKYTVDLTIQEAKELYKDLGELFGRLPSIEGTGQYVPGLQEEDESEDKDSWVAAIGSVAGKLRGGINGLE